MFRNPNTEPRRAQRTRSFTEKTRLELSCFVGFKYFKTQQLGFVSRLVALGLNPPLKHAVARNKRGGVSARERGSEPIPPAADSIVRSEGAFVFRGVAFFAYFLGEARK
ncbi:hypothetical protein CSQ88_10225 [Iodobacter sp. BJB302]|nr:hypothetical protein CSQ88_10225 [Iodobacter sp. BJB302]